jgi:hypothetical protein
MKSRRFTAVSLCQWHTLTQHFSNLWLKSPVHLSDVRCGSNSEVSTRISDFRSSPNIGHH